MRRATLLLALALAVFAWTSPASAAKRVALVIGIDAYDSLPALQKAVNDEKAVAAALAGLGFEVVTGENLTRREMNAKLAELDAKIEPGDTVFFYFAGHGVALGAENYLLPRDLPKPRDGEENMVRDEGHAVDAIVRRVQTGAVSFFVLDACRDNPLAASGVRSIGGTRGLTRVDTPNGVFVLFSAGLGQTALDRLADDDPDPNSVFTRKLVPLLKTPGLTQVTLAKRVQREVDALASSVRHPQQPAYYDQIIGEIELSPPPSASSAPAAIAIVTQPSAPVVPPRPIEPTVVTIPKSGAEATRYKPGDIFQDCDVCPEMVVLPAGEFMMGSPPNEAQGRNEGPQHHVQIFAAGLEQRLISTAREAAAIIKIHVEIFGTDPGGQSIRQTLEVKGLGASITQRVAMGALKTALQFCEENPHKRAATDRNTSKHQRSCLHIHGPRNTRS